MAVEMSHMVSVMEASIKLGICADTLRTWDRNGDFPATRYRRWRVYDMRELDDLVLFCRDRKEAVGVGMVREWRKARGK